MGASRWAGLALVAACLPAAAAASHGSDAASCDGARVEFPRPTVAVERRGLTSEQAWMEEHWPGYRNGVSLGGSFVIENWMFFHKHGPYSREHLRLPELSAYDQHAWCKDLLKGDLRTAYDTVDCHLTKFYSDEELDVLAEFGINSVRLPVGYWNFDDPELYPDDTWSHLPEGDSPYGVNPDGFIAPGTGRLADFVVRLYNRNMNVILDMHALPGCSSPPQSYAGIRCEAHAPNLWNGEAHDGISGGHTVTRADDGKSWADVAWKITLERVVPWLKFMEDIAPGAIIAFETINEPDILKNDASADAIRDMTLDLGKEVVACLGHLADKVKVGISTGLNSYATGQAARDMLGPKYSGVAHEDFWADLHHYFFWTGCVDHATSTFSVQCACESNLEVGARYWGEDKDWEGWADSSIFLKGGRFYVGEWTAGLLQARACQGGMPSAHTAGVSWQAQKWGFVMHYLRYQGAAVGGKSSFVGDYYWNGRMGHNWNPDPTVCAGPSLAGKGDYEDFESWDWSLLRLIKLGLAKKLSALGWTNKTMLSRKAASCSGAILINCGARLLEDGAAAASSGVVLPGMAFETAAGPVGVARAGPARLAAVLPLLAGCGVLVASAAVFLRRRLHGAPSADEERETRSVLVPREHAAEEEAADKACA